MKEIDFPSPNNNELSVFPYLGRNNAPTSALPFRNLCKHVQILGTLQRLCQFIGTCCTLMSRNHCFLLVIYHLWILQSFYPLFYINFWVLRWESQWRVNEESMNISIMNKRRVEPPLHIISLGMTVLIAILCKNSVWWGLSYVLIYGYRNMSWE